jgi:predicted adenylyl cyclase CyaB
MSRNIEIKARLADPAAFRARVEELADEGPTLLEQEDTFFFTRRGRLKLRKQTGGSELIYYERSNTTGPAESQYFIERFADPSGIEAMLSVALDVRGTVSKSRRLYRIGQTRVHIDEVLGLGSFVELEVELNAIQASSEGEAIARELIERLQLGDLDLVAESYIDLLEGPAGSPASE